MDSVRQGKHTDSRKTERITHPDRLEPAQRIRPTAQGCTRQRSRIEEVSGSDKGEEFEVSECWEEAEGEVTV